MSTWEERMSERAAARQAARVAAATPEQREADPELDPFPGRLIADPPDGTDDVEPRWWCTRCGLPDAPHMQERDPDSPPCPRCGSRWRWYGRVCDLNGTATEPPAGQCLDCFEWVRRSSDRFGWTWLCRCLDDSLVCRFDHRHHDGEIVLA